MELFSVEPASRSAVFSHAGEETPTWLSVDLRFVIAAVVVLGAVAATTIRFSHEVFDPLADALKIQGWAAIIARPSLLWFTMGMVLIVIRTLLWVRYRPVAAVSPDGAPRMSIVIPAYNEGMMVRKAVDACAHAEYPRDRLEIIVIDDGSTDDTWTHVDAAQRERADLVQAVRLPANAGKRAALAAGFARATGEILVTVDSDSLVERGALLAIAGPFRNERVGAVAATNDVLAAGYQAVYQCSAVVQALVPETYRKLCRMFLRWDRSYIREEIRLWRIMWKLPFPAMVLTLIETTVTNLRYPVAYSSLGLMFYLSVQDPLTIVRLLISIGIVSIFYSLYFLHSERS